MTYAKRGKKNSIQPISDSGAVVGYPRVPANVNDEPTRLAMDDSSDEEERVEEKKEKQRRMFRAKTNALINVLRALNRPEDSTTPALEPVQTLEGGEDDERKDNEGNDNESGEDGEVSTLEKQ